MTTSGARVLGFLQNDPLRGAVALRTLDDVVGLPARAEDAGVATVVDGAALLSRTRLPMTAVPPSWATAVGAPRGRATVVQIGIAADGRRAGERGAQAGPHRARAYAAAIVGGPDDESEAAATRERLLVGLPDFLRRCVTGRSEGEAVFLAALARLHARGLLDANHNNADALREAVIAVLDEVDAGRGAARHVTITNGVEILHLARGMRSAVVTLTGLVDDLAGSVDPAFADSSSARERNRRYRAIAVLAGVGGLLAAPPHHGVAVDEFDASATIVVGRDLSVRSL
jgi:hypothetical protein